MPPNPIEMPTWRPLFISFFILWHWHMYLWEILRYLFFYEPSIQQNPTVELPWSNTKFLWGSTTKYQGGTQQILINIFKFKKGTWVQVSHHYPMCHRHDKTCTVPSIRGDDWNSDLNNLRPPHETARSRKIGELRIKVVRASPVATLDPSLPYLYRLVSPLPPRFPKRNRVVLSQPLILTLEPEEATDGHRLLIGFVIGVIMPLSLWVSVSSTPMDTLKTSSAPASSPSAALQPAEEAARAHTNSYHVQSWSQVVQIKSLQHRHNNIHK
jgi:hypothetical protein